MDAYESECVGDYIKHHPGPLLREFQERVEPLVDDLAKMVPESMQQDLFEVAKPVSQKQRILDLLRHCPNGVTSRDLNKIAYRYSARIMELRRDGHVIEVSRIKDGLFRFKLVQS